MDLKMSDTCKKLSMVIVVLGAISLVVGLFFADSKIHWLFGIVLGTLVSVVKVYMLERALDKAVDMEPKDATNYTRANYTMRLVISVGVVVIACVTKQFNVGGVLIGLLLVQPAAYITNFIITNKEKIK